jgi:chromosome segregation ATPase
VLDSKETREAVHAAELEAKDKEIARLQGRCDDLNTLLDLNKDELEKQAAELTALRSKGQVTEQELITLKARLYDLMVENR